MANLSGPQLTQLALQAGFPPADAQTAAAVALAESSGNPNALNPSGASGLWQILRSAHKELFQQYVWNDPAQNAKMAFIVWQQAGNSFRPWTTYTSGRYKLFMTQTGSANSSGVLTGATIGDAIGGSAAPATDASTVTDFISEASDPEFWLRVGMFMGGVVLALIGLHGLLNHSTAYQNVTKSVSSLASKAAVVAV